MKISEMNNCIEEMRKCYNFKDDETADVFVLVQEMKMGQQLK